MAVQRLTVPFPVYVPEQSDDSFTGSFRPPVTFPVRVSGKPRFFRRTNRTRMFKHLPE